MNKIKFVLRKIDAIIGIEEVGKIQERVLLVILISYSLLYKSES